MTKEEKAKNIQRVEEALRVTFDRDCDFSLAASKIEAALERDASFDDLTKMLEDVQVRSGGRAIRKDCTYLAEKLQVWHKSLTS